MTHESDIASLAVSTFEAPVVAYAAEPHPNADSLEMAIIGGWRAACRIGEFTPGQQVAYIPEGAVLPQYLIVELNLHDPPRLAGPDHNRVKALRLRGLLSQGIVCGGDRIAGLGIGDNAVDALGLVKWVPEVPDYMLGIMAAGPKITYDIDDIKSWPGRMAVEEECVVTEKLHGVLCCLGVRRETTADELEPVVSSKGTLAQGLRFEIDSEDNADNVYVAAWRQHAPAIYAEFERLSPDATCLYVFGELCGPEIQDLNYGLARPTLHVFDMRLDDGYAPWDDISAAARRIGAATVPVLWRGPWSESLLAEHTNGPSTVGPHHREGIVVRPTAVRYDTGLDHPSGRGPGRVVFKTTSEKHLLRKGGTEHN